MVAALEGPQVCQLASSVLLERRRDPVSHGVEHERGVVTVYAAIRIGIKRVAPLVNEDFLTVKARVKLLNRLGLGRRLVLWLRSEDRDLY